MANICIVDDSEMVRIKVKECLVASGHTIIEGDDGKVGFDQVTKNAKTLDLVITDLNMPNMNGLEMVAKLREQAETQKIPVVMLTTEGTPEIKAEGKKLGVIGWIVKPLDQEKLAMNVNKLLEKLASKAAS